jgi:signal transduction histidine kinase
MFKLRLKPIAGLIGLAVLLIAAAFWRHYRNPSRGLPFYEAATERTADQWTAYGGTWEISSGAMRNESSERGAKLLTGSAYWKDYAVDADVELLGPGDAGVVVRVSDAEKGVDSYSGYYVGLRTLNSSLLIGGAHHFWQEFASQSLPDRLEPFQWYHLHVNVIGCKITAVATSHSTGKSARLSVDAGNCYGSGRVGLRSYSSGGIWRNIAITSAVEDRPGQHMVKANSLPASDRLILDRNIRGSYLQSLSSTEDQPVFDRSRSVQSISSLRLLASQPAEPVSVRGVVILASPHVYVQDSTGGVAVPSPGGPRLKVGDEVEVRGTPTAHGLHLLLERATVLVLWEGEPPPPYSVTLNQAATGAYDSMFIEVEGVLRNKKQGSKETLVLDLDGKSQAFRAVMNPGRSTALFRKLSVGSMLRLRGICVVDPEFTHNQSPFALLVRSAEDVQVISGPPWWSWRFLMMIAAAATLLALLAYVLYLRARNWRMCAVLEERGRLAHEIHDTLAQSFAGIGFQLQAIRNRLPARDTVLEQQVDLACSLVRHSHEETRRSIAALRPESRLDRGGLPAALKECAERMVQGGSLAIRVSSNGPPANLPLRIENNLLRIGQEATANAVGHSKAGQVSIDCVYRKDTVLLRVEDDGIGFNIGAQSAGFGLIGMRKRAVDIGAQLVVASSPGKGTRVEVIAPIPRKSTLKVWASLVGASIRGESSLGNKQRDPYSYRG